MILALVDIVSRGGNLLLDIGPTADGRIPVIMQQRLGDIGSWLSINGEAIYGTDSWKNSYQWSEGKRPEKKGESFMAGYDVADLIKPKKEQAHIEYFFTRKGKDLYCIVPAYMPQLRIKDCIANTNAKATILGSNKKLNWKQQGNDVSIDLSVMKPGDMSAELFAIKLQNAL